MVADERIGDILVSRGNLTREEAEAVASERMRSDTRYASIALRTGRVTIEHALEALGAKSGYPPRDLAKVVIPKSVLRLIPFEIARQQLLLPFAIEGRNLLLAMANPNDRQVIEEVSFATGLVVRPHIALHAQLATSIIEAHCATGDYYFGPGVSDEKRNIAIEQPPLVEEDNPAVSEEASDGENEIAIEVESADFVPETPVAPEGLKPPSNGQLPQQQKRILVVEDEPQIQQLIFKVLQALDCEVIVASRGLQALKLIKTEKPDLIVLDAMLPEVHGFEICRKVKESKRFGATPVLMISAIYRGWRIAEDIKSTYGVDDFLEKPFRVAELRTKVEQLLENNTKTSAAADMDSTAKEFFNEAIGAFKDADYTRAFDKLRQAEEIEPFSARVQFAIGQVLEKDDRTFQGMYHYERAIELDPNMYAAAQNLALLYQAKGFKRKAIEMWERALLSAPSTDIRENIKRHLVNIL